ncbi:unnamed protein product [Pieris brassicae]|uniref:Uncharacterized protein n=1 Tax=Pieris brassicae TaxID=7116 RepID=A0A9P0SZ75_PIEBR|nr:unnamed protein product [Pieris brassicae]
MEKLAPLRRSKEIKQDGPKQGFGINTIKQKGYSQRIKDLLCKQEAFFRSSDHRSIECDIDAITEKWELVAELEEMRSRGRIYNIT